MYHARMEQHCIEHNGKLVLDGISLSCLVSFLRPRLCGARVQKVSQVSREFMFIKFYPCRPAFLAISIIPGLNAVFLCDSQRTAPPRPMAFQMLLRKQIGKAGISDIRQNHRDRTIVMDFSTREGVFQLVADLFGGAGANVLLVRNGVILGDIKARSTSLPYEPRVPERVDPFSGVFHAETENVLDTYQGFSKLRSEQFNKSGMNMAQYMELVNKQDSEALHARLTQKFYWLYDTYYIGREKKALLKRIRRKKKRLEMKLNNAEKGIAASKEAEHWETTGTLLISSQCRNEKMESIEVTDWDGNEKIIDLDPRLTVKDNAERFFKRSKKLKKDGKRLVQLKQNLEHDLENLLELEEKISRCDEYFSLKELGSMLEVKKEPLSQPGKKEQIQENPHYISFQSPSGFAVLVAKSATSSEILTFYTAKPHDYFFHVQNYPGAHVILRRNRVQDVPEKDLVFAAELAVRHSKNDRTTAIVSYTEVRYVNKLKGRYTGKVLLSEFKTLKVRT